MSEHKIPDGSTHYEGCWQDRRHHDCALGRIAKLEAERDRLEGLTAELSADAGIQAFVDSFEGIEAENAQLRAERDELERKGKDLCCAYGNALITIADLKRDFARPVSMKEMPVGAEFSQVKVNALLAARAAGKGE